jgi:hypothetical protein
VTEWQYSLVRGILAERADLMIWLDLTRGVVMWQVVRRTLRRRLRREVLWNGNIEPPLRTIFSGSGHIVRWAWSTHHKSAPRVVTLQVTRPDMVVVRRTPRAAVERWLTGALSVAAAGKSAAGQAAPPGSSLARRRAAARHPGG